MSQPFHQICCFISSFQIGLFSKIVVRILISLLLEVVYGDMPRVFESETRFAATMYVKDCWNIGLSL
jgi:hypothetical protein